MSILTTQDKLLILGAFGAPETANNVISLLESSGGSVSGPVSSTDNALVRFDGITGAVIQNSSVTLSDAGALSGITDFSNSGQILASAGSVTLPSYSFSGDPNLGIFRVSTDTLGFTTNGSLAGSVDSSQLWTLGTSNSSQSHVVNGRQLGLFATGDGNPATYYAKTTGTNSTDHVRIQLEAQGTGGDTYAQFKFTNTITQQWTLGARRSTGGTFAISGSSALGTSDYLTIDNTGVVTIPRQQTIGLQADPGSYIFIGNNSSVLSTTTQCGFRVGGTTSTFNAAATANMFPFRSDIRTDDGSYTTAVLGHFNQSRAMLGTGHTVTREVAYRSVGKAAGSGTVTQFAVLADNVTFSGDQFISQTGTNPSVLAGQFRVGSLGVANSAAATTPGTVTKKIEVFDASGTSLGFVAVYDAIT